MRFEDIANYPITTCTEIMQFTMGQGSVSTNQNNKSMKKLVAWNAMKIENVINDIY